MCARVQIVYPVPDTAALEALSTGHSGAGELQARAELLKRHGLPTAHRAPFFLSINRFERKKNLRLALDALVELHRLLEEDAAASPGSRLAARASELRPRLVFCGGYDERVVDCVSTARQLDELSRRAFPNSDSSTELTSPNADAEGRTLTETTDDRYVYLVRNVSSLEKAYLLRNALALIYTPVEEHFGIVPVEAMRLGMNIVHYKSLLLFSSLCLVLYRFTLVLYRFGT